MMLSRKLLIASLAFIILTAAALAAPVEDKEPEENDFEAEEGEEELSEEEEDDDDSNGQHIKGAGAQRPTMVPKGPGVTVLPGTSLVGEPPNGHKGNEAAAAQTSHGSSSGSATAFGTDGRDSQALPSSSQVIGVAVHWSSASKVPGAADTAYSDTVSHGSSQVLLSHVSSGQESSLMASGQTSGSAFVSSEVQTQTEGESQTVHIGSQIEAPGSESVIEKPETETNGNGHKHLINGQETGHSGMNNFMEDTTAIDSTGGFDSFGSNLEITGIIDHSSNDLLVGLMGGMRDSFAPVPYTDTTGPGLDPGLLSFISSAPPAPHSEGNGQVAFATDFSVIADNGAQYYSPGEMAEGADNNGADSPSINGNGRLRPVTDVHKGGASIHLYTKEHQGLIADMGKILDVIDPTISTIRDLPLAAVVTSHAGGVGMHTDVTGFEGQPVTNGYRQIDITIMGESSSRPPDSLGYESNGVTEGISNHTDSVTDPRAGFTDASRTQSSMVQTELMVTGDPAGVSSQTDTTGTAVAEPQGTFRGLSQPGATEQTQPAVPAGEQYHTSGQGAEGAENVELEDTC